jgi:hypothetical protein
MKGERGMNKNKKLLAVLLLSMIALAGVAYAIIYWTRTITHNFTIIGINADLIEPTFNGYENKVIATDLLNSQIGIIAYKISGGNIWLNITVTSNCPGLTVSMQGQY